MNERSIIQWFGNRDGHIIIAALRSNDQTKINKTFSELAPQLRQRFNYSV